MPFDVHIIALFPHPLGLVSSQQGFSDWSQQQHPPVNLGDVLL